MKLLVFTSNQRRHIALLDALLADHDVTAIIEPKTWILPESGVLHDYWRRVRDAETALFPEMFSDVPTMAIRPGEASRIAWDYNELVKVDRFLVFSSSYLTGPLADFLIQQGALNLHVGLAPEYRGSAPNLWAALDGRPDLIGAQVQRLSTGLDAGEILAEVRPPLGGDYFTRSMLAVKLGIEAMVKLLDTPEPWPSIRANDRAQELRYSRHADFTEEIAGIMLAANA